MLAKAIRIAALKHGQAVDKGAQPFIGHPLRVMARVAASQPHAPEWVLEAAVMHDVFEDTGTDPMEAVALGASKEGVALALILTRVEEEEGYFDYVGRVKKGELHPKYAEWHVALHSESAAWAIAIKIEDLGDNLNPIRRVPGMKLPDRYERAMAMLA